MSTRRAWEDGYRDAMTELMTIRRATLWDVSIMLMKIQAEYTTLIGTKDRIAGRNEAIVKAISMLRELT